MKALVYQGPGKKAWQDVPPGPIQHPTDAIVRGSNLSVPPESAMRFAEVYRGPMGG